MSEEQHVTPDQFRVSQLVKRLGELASRYEKILVEESLQRELLIAEFNNERRAHRERVTVLEEEIDTLRKRTAELEVVLATAESESLNA
jgi:hypothetical protein